MVNIMFDRKKKKQHSYDKTAKKLVIHTSICTGEKVAGFKDLQTGKFTDIMLIRNKSDLKNFCDEYGIEEAELGEDY